MIKKITRLGILLIVICIEAQGQNFQNLDIKQECDSSKTGLCFWDLSLGSKQSVYSENKDLKNAVAIVGQKENSVMFAEQEVFKQRAKEIKNLSISST
ncbi:MAG: hypothetical protein WAT79_05710 [Saprospiraceae bacterium]